MTNAGRAIVLRLQHLGLLHWKATVDRGEVGCRARVPRRCALEARRCLSENPNAPDHFTIFHRDHARFL